MEGSMSGLMMRGALAAALPRRTAGRSARRVVPKVSAEFKDISYDQESRQKIQRGIDKLADAVGVTLGPRGRNVVLEEKFGVPQVINDGVTIARAIQLPDPTENAGAQLIKEVAGRTNDSAGDGTTTACILARELILFGLQAVAAGANPVALKKGMDKACTFLVGKLEENAKPIRGSDDIKAVAAISAGNDEKVGELIAGAIEKVGPDGVLSIESGTGLETTVDVEEGMEIDRGYISPQFVTNNERLTVELENVRVLITDQKIEKVSELIPVLEKITKVNAPLMIIAEDITGEALATLVVNKLRGVISVVAIKAPGFGERRKSLLQDIAIVTGAEFIAKDLGLLVDAAEIDQLGYIRKLTVRKDSCTLIADAGSAEEIKARVAQLKKELSDSTSTYDQEKISERIAKLSGGVAVIKVGAATEAELEDKKLRIEDAKNATFAAVEEGVVPGGGAAFVHLSVFLTEFKKGLKDEELMGAEIVQKAITAPCRLIANNAGVEGEVVVQRVAKSPWEVGYNAMTDTYENLLETGVLDPKKVTRSGLQNAVSVAGMVLTTQAVITEKVKPKVGAAAGGKPQPGSMATGNMPPGYMSL